MTIEIKQLVIRAVVDARRVPAEQSAEPQVAAVAQPRSSTPVEPGPVKIDQELLRTMCARELRRELRKARER